MSEPLDLDLEHAWSRMATHLEWADRFWVLFVFTDDPRVSDELRERAQKLLEGAGKPLVWLRAEQPDRIDEVIGQLVEGPAKEIAWIDLVRHDDATGEPGWGKAWERVMLRLNERRELLRRRAPTGGVVFATTVDRLDETAATAPDLWTIRALLLRVVGGAVAADREPTERMRTEDWGWQPRAKRDPELARMAVEKARARGDALGLLGALVVLAEAESGDAALGVAREARALIEGLDATKEVVHALARLGEVLGREEYDADAETCFRRAIELGEQVHGSRRDPDIAASLHGLGNVLAHVAEYSPLRSAALEEESVEVMREAVEIWRPLSTRRPDEFLARLAVGLHDLARQLSELGRNQAALAPAHEATEIHRSLVSENPDAFLPGLARSLKILSVVSYQLGQLQEALAWGQEAVAVWRGLADKDPNAFSAEFVSSLAALAVTFVALGRRRDALEVRSEVLAIRRRLSNDGVFIPGGRAPLVTLVRQLPPHRIEPEPEPEPESEQPLELDPPEDARTYLVRWAVIILVVALVLALVSSLV